MQHRLLKQVRSAVRSVAEADAGQAGEKLDALIDAAKTVLARKSRAGSLSAAEKTHNKKIVRFYTDAKKSLQKGENIKEIFNEKIIALKADVDNELTRIDNLFAGMDKIFGSDGNEMLILVTELTLDTDTAEFLSEFKSESYEKYNSVLKVGDRAENLRREIAALEELS